MTHEISVSKATINAVDDIASEINSKLFLLAYIAEKEGIPTSVKIIDKINNLLMGTIDVIMDCIEKGEREDE